MGAQQPIIKEIKPLKIQRKVVDQLLPPQIYVSYTIFNQLFQQQVQLDKEVKEILKYIQKKYTIKINQVKINDQTIEQHKLSSTFRNLGFKAQEKILVQFPGKNCLRHDEMKMNINKNWVIGTVSCVCGYSITTFKNQA